MDSPETQVDRTGLPEEMRQKLKRMERPSPWEMGLIALFTAALLGMVFSAAFGRGDLRANLQVSGPFVFGVLAVVVLLTWFAQDRGRRARIAQFQALTEMLHRHACNELATRDPVSGAYNRATLQELSDRYFNRALRTGKPLTLALFSLDGLRQISHSFGLAGADLALAEFARVLQSSTRGTDAVARYEAEEFAALLADTARIGAELAVLRVKERLSTTGVRLFEEDVPLRFSAGAAVFQRGMDFATLLREARVDLFREQAARGGTAAAAEKT